MRRGDTNKTSKVQDILVVIIMVTIWVKVIFVDHMSWLDIKYSLFHKLSISINPRRSSAVLSTKNNVVLKLRRSAPQVSFTTQYL